MGMDVYGKNPSSEAGKYFRASVWVWRPLADFVEFLCKISQAEDLYNQCTHWQTNDGDGLEAEGAKHLGGLLRASLPTLAPSYVEERSTNIARLPNVPCRFCDGTGCRNDDVGRAKGMPEKPIPAKARDVDNVSPHPRAGKVGWCNACDGRGYNRPDVALYPLNVEDIERWTAFVEASGGFEIH